MSTKKILEAYQKCVNHIEDFLEYRYLNYNVDKVRTAVLSHITKLAKDLEEINNG